MVSGKIATRTSQYSWDRVEDRAKYIARTEQPVNYGQERQEPDRTANRKRKRTGMVSEKIGTRRKGKYRTQ
jgi:hypothetical protein